MRKLLLFLLLCFAVSALFSFPVSATHDAKANSGFSDMDQDHWSFESAMKMISEGIMETDAKGRFNPAGQVSRGEFAMLMVKVLELPLINPAEGSFLDIPKSSKYYQYVETAKYYLTGYRTTQGDYFRPDELSVREDIAVSMVKALGYQPINNYEAILKDYKDLEQISPNLRSYAASVVDNEIMVGSGTNERKMFNAQGILTRAEVAKLLSNILEMEKVTYDEGDKVTYEPEEITPTPTPITAAPKPAEEISYTPQVKVQTADHGLKVSWTKTAEGNFSYYKVVLSKSDSSPSYPDDGYITYLSDIHTTQYTVSPGQDYNGGDISRITSGEKYYITITAVYNHGKYTGNVVYKKMP